MAVCGRNFPGDWETARLKASRVAGDRPSNLSAEEH